MKILVADDSRLNLKMLQAMLEQFGFDSDSAPDGIEVLNAVVQKQYDLILMDVNMPGMDGIEAAGEIIQNVEPEKRPRIVLMTADEAEKSRCLEAGIDDFITKPVKRHKLEEILRNIRFSEMETPQEPAEVPIINEDTVKSLREMGNDKFKMFVDMFTDEDGPELVAKIIRFYTEGNAEKTGGTAHALKGVSSNIGADRLASLCRIIEQKGKDGDIDGMGKQLDRLKNVFAESCEKLKELFPA